MKRLIIAVTDLREFQRFEQRPFVRENQKITEKEHVSLSDEGPLLEML